MTKVTTTIFWAIFPDLMTSHGSNFGKAYPDLATTFVR